MARLPFIGIPGIPQAGGCVIRVLSHSNAVMTWTCQNQSGTVTLAQCGTNRGSADPGGQTFAGYIGTITITGLVGNGLAQYSVPITQNGVTLTAKFRLAPTLGQKYQTALTTCYDVRSGVSSGSAVGITLSTPITADIVASDDPPMACWINVDDLMYLDATLVDDTSGTGRKSTGYVTGITPENSHLQYDYIVGWMERLGMLGNGQVDENRAIFMERNHLFRVGNHDVMFLIGGLASEPFGNLPNSYSATGTPNKDGSGFVVWNQIFSHCHGTNIANRDTLAEPWALVLGGVKFVCPDPLPRTTAGDWLGNNQVDDCLDALNTDEKIKFLLLQHPPKDVLDTVSGVSASKGPMDGATGGQVTRMMRTSSVNALNISSNVKTNGQKGICIVTSGDQHTAHVYKAVAATEKFLVWCCGSVTSGSHNDGTLAGVKYIVEGGTYSGCEVLYQCYYQVPDPRGSARGWTKIVVFGDEFPLRTSMEHRRDFSLDHSGPMVSGFTRHFTSHGLTDNYGSATPVRMAKIGIGPGE